MPLHSLLPDFPALFLSAGPLLLALFLAMPSEAAPRPKAGLYVATNGNDSWSGALPAPNQSATDGPFATIDRARREVRERRHSKPPTDPIRVQIRGGLYPLLAPVSFGPEDSGAPGAPIVYEAYPGEKPVFSGGRRVSGWRVINGRWVADLPEIRKGGWNFTQLWVKGERRYRPRLPKEGWAFIEDALPPTEANRERGFDRFRFKEGDIRGDWSNRDDVEVLPVHIWTMSRMRIASVDEADQTVTFTGHTRGTSPWAALPKGNRYLVENVKEALDRPGEWYLDRGEGILTYLPLPGEDPKKTEVIAPLLEQILILRGDPAKREWVHDVIFRGLTFAHTNWNLPPEGQSYPQGEVNLSSAITVEGSRDCSFQSCEIRGVGGYAIELTKGSKRNRIEKCVLTDMAAGGVKLGETSAPEDDEMVASHNIVRDCVIAHGGRMHSAAIGVWLGHTPYNRVEHNDIFDFYYTGVSVGWSWGYGRSLAHHNLIAYNHIHHLGQGVLSDMGGIYTLGVAPGSVLHHNRIHDVTSFAYGGWGIYFDEGTTEMLAENNLAYRTKSAPFHQHYGKENRVVNNILAYGREAQLMRTRPEEHLSFTIERNIVFWTDGPLFGSNWTDGRFAIDRNLYWNAAGREFNFAGMTLKEWREKGYDRNSVIADPLFIAPEKGDFRLRPGSPAEKIGFRQIDTSDIGPRPAVLRNRKDPLAPRAFPEPSPPQPIVEDFEGTPPGEKASLAVTVEENDRATARVTEETAASGKRSLRLTDQAGQQNNWNPHLYYNPDRTEGTMRGGFDLRIEPGAVLYHEWRDGSNPYRIGPSLRIDTEGNLIANGRPLLQIPPRQWIEFEIVCALGDAASGRYDLTVAMPGKAPVRFDALPCDAAFVALRWFGFTADGTDDAIFYLDNIRLRPV